MDNDTFAWSGAHNFNHEYERNGLNQYTQINPPGVPTPPTVAFTYDGRGNLQTGGPVSYYYTAENRVAVTTQLDANQNPFNHYLSYEPGTGELFAMYKPGPTDPMDTIFLTSGGRIIDEINLLTSQRVARYVFGPGVDEPIVSYNASGVRSWLIADERGSIIAKTDASGNATATAAYDEYGIPSGGDVGRYGYTGQAMLHEIGVNYYKARMYSPTLGRFLQTDPIGYGDGLNNYAYVHNDPVNSIDPTGLADWTICNGGQVYAGNSACDGAGEGGIFEILVIWEPSGGGLRSGEISGVNFWSDAGNIAGGGEDGPQKTQTPTCPKGGRITLGLGGSASGAFLYTALGIGAEAGISIPTDFFSTGSLRGTQFYGSASFQGLVGFGFFAGAGGTPSAGYSSGPIQSGVSGTHVVGGGAALGGGGEVSVATNGSGGSISGGPRAGVGAYAGYGGKVTATAATPQLGCTP